MVLVATWCLGALLAVGSVDSNWCDIVFRDVARAADTVVIARVERAEHGAPSITVEEVLKGSVSDPTEIRITLEMFPEMGLRPGDHVLVALGDDGGPLQTIKGWGACRAVSALRIRKGRLKRVDRIDYDYLERPLTLDELRDQLRHDLGTDPPFRSASPTTGAATPR